MHYKLIKKQKQFNMKILKIDSSSNKVNSMSRKFTDKIVNQLAKQNKHTEIIERDTTYSDIPFIDMEILGSLFVQGKRTQEQKQALKFSDELVDEFISADVVILGAPFYNFSVPASLKAYFDLISRAGRTFGYDSDGVPFGMVPNKKIYVVITSGGTEIGGDADFLSGYIKYFFSFLGITDVTLVPLDQLGRKGEEKIQQAEKFIQTIN